MELSTGFLQSHRLQHHILSISPSIHTSSNKRYHRRSIVSFAKRSADGGADFRRRAVLLVGVSLLPLVDLRAAAIEGRGARRGSQIIEEIRRLARIQKEKQDNESTIQEQESQPLAKDISPQEPESQLPKQLEEEVLPQASNQTKERIHENALKDSPLDSDNKDVTTLEGETKQEVLPQQTKSEQDTQNSSGNAFLSFANALGIIGSGVLGALYAESRTEKKDLESAIDSIKEKLAEEEKASTLLKEEYEARLLKEQEEKRKQIGKLKEKEASLSSQLASANATLTGLRHELGSEQRLGEELKVQKTQFGIALSQAAADKKMLEAKIKEKLDTVDVLQDRVSLLTLEINDKEKTIDNLRISLTEKESECKRMNSVIDQTKAASLEANAMVESLKVDNTKLEEDLNSKGDLVDKLGDKTKSLEAEKDEVNKRINELKKEFYEFKSNSERRIAEDSSLLSEKDERIRQLEEKLALAFSEAGNNQAVIKDLEKDRDEFKARLDEEINSAKLLKDELRASQEALETSRTEASSLSKDLEEAKRSRDELISKLQRVEDEFTEAKKSFYADLDKARSALKLLSEELATMRGILKNTSQELDATSEELKAVKEDRESLKKELVDIYKKAETSANELKEERKIVATLNKELEVLAKQLQKDSKAREALEADLDEATKSLDEMNQSALLLSKELENINSRTSSLEAETQILYKALKEQKDLTKESQENLEDAQNLIARLGNERDNLEAKSLKLEEELASAKGEILRLRRGISTKKDTNNEHTQAPNSISSGTPFAARKTGGRRRKGGQASDS